MMSEVLRLLSEQPAQCPYVDGRDTRCGRTLTLENLSSALALCAGRYTRCPVYHQIRAEQAVCREASRSTEPLTTPLAAGSSRD